MVHLAREMWGSKCLLDPLRSYQVLGGEGPRQTICEGPWNCYHTILYHKDQMANGNKLTRHLSQSLSSVTQSCPTLCDPMNRSMPGLRVHHQLPEFTQTHVHRVRDAIQPSHPRSSPSLPAPNPSQHQSLFQWVSSSHEVAKVLVHLLNSGLIPLRFVQ